MKISRRAAASIILGAPVWAQNAAKVPQPAEDPQNRISIDVSRVNILFTVSDKRGRFVTNLTKDDFEVFENKKRQQVLEFTAESDLPLRLALLIDTSNSVRDRFRFEQEAAVEFLNSLLRPGADRAMIMGFDTAAELVSDLTDDHEKLIKAIRDLRPGGGTAFYDAIFRSCKDKLMQDQPRHKFRRAVVVLSDGD
ncbi:MAG: VWA domain-containing protein, partial [Bryobacteraceae bacterium]|nr:VWA domain-containing protein [Bryobacteraceae bacterium]